MMEHFRIDNPDKKSAGGDSEYEKAEQDALEDNASYEKPEERYEDTLPLPPAGEKESFNDPDFDALWDSIEDEDSDKEVVGENDSDLDFHPLGEEEFETSNEPIEDDWTEVT